MKKKRRLQFCVSLPPDLIRRIRAVAANRGIYRSRLIEDAVRAYLP